MEKADFLLEKAIEFITHYGPKLLGAILIYIIGSWIIKRLMVAFGKALSTSKYDFTLQRFFNNILSWSLKIILILLVISTLGIDVTTFAALIAAAGLAVGLALQGSLANFAGGVLIMIFKPYRIGDLIEAQGLIGEVKEIDIFNTQLVSPENKRVIIPNGAMANGNIVNYTVEGKIRVDVQVGVAYSSDLQKAKSTLMAVLTDNEKVLKNPQPYVGVSDLSSSSITLVVRPYCKPEDYWDVYFGTYENIKIALDKSAIEIPFTHVVHINR